MSLERYFQRAHDEARRLLRDTPWRPHAARAMPPGKRWRVFLDNGASHSVCREASEEAVGEVKTAYAALEPAPVVAAVLRVAPGWLQSILDRAMADTDGSPTLAPGEGAEARRLLTMVAWDRVPQARWPAVFAQLRMAGLQRDTSPFPPDGWLQVWLEQSGIATVERNAA